MSDNGKILGALVLGAAAGAVLGLLFAPAKGSDLRKKISDNAGDFMDELADKINEGKEMLNGLKEKAASKVDDVRERAEEEFNGMKTKVKSTVNNA